MSAYPESTTTLLRCHRHVAQTRENTRLLASPIVRTQVLDRARYHRAGRTPGELSSLIVEDLRHRWPGLDEPHVDAIIADEAFARGAEAEAYRGAMQSGLSVGLQAARDVREEGVDYTRDGFGRPAGRKPARTERGAA
ncbi:MAG: hypothetical protein ABFD89_11400 [Bryobacteraceae bacterium]